MDLLVASDASLRSAERGGAAIADQRIAPKIERQITLQALDRILLTDTRASARAQRMSLSAQAFSPYLTPPSERIPKPDARLPAATPYPRLPMRH